MASMFLIQSLFFFTGFTVSICKRVQIFIICKINTKLKFIYIFRLIQITRILYNLYIHYNMFRVIFMAICRYLHIVYEE